MSFFVDDLADYLALEGLGTVSTDIFVARIPASPDTLLALFPTGGFTSDGKWGYDDITVQLRSRGSNPLTGYDVLNNAYNVLQGLHNVTIGATFVVNITALQSQPTLIGEDDNSRSEYTQNYKIRIRNVTQNRV